MDSAILELDALTEIANVGMSRAATQLSMLLNDEVDVGVPKVYIVGTGDVGGTLGLTADEEICCVRQDLNGGLNGKALLLFHTEESKALINALIGTVPTLTGVDMRNYEHEAMMEIGNIVISAGTATIADMMGSEITLSVPVYSEETVGALVKNHLNTLGEIATQVVIFKATLNASKRKVSGDLIILLGVESVDELLQKVREFIDRGLKRKDSK